MNSDIISEIARAVSNLETLDKLKGLVNKALSEDISALDIVHDGLRKGLEDVGRKYEAGEFFLSELLYSGMLMNETLSILEPRLKMERPQNIGSIVLGTVRGDLHDIGKNIFKMMAQGVGFEIYDLGVDVEPNTFITKLGETNANILGLSALLTTTIDEMRNVIDLLKESGMRDHVKIVLGGNAVDKEFAEKIGADASASDAVEGVRICREWVDHFS